MNTKNTTPVKTEISPVSIIEDTSTNNTFHGVTKNNAKNLPIETKTNDEVFTVSEGKTPEEDWYEISFDSDETNIEKTILKKI